MMDYRMYGLTMYQLNVIMIILPVFSSWLDVSEILSTESSCTLENSSEDRDV